MSFPARLFVCLTIVVGSVPAAAVAQSSSVANPQGGQEYPACCEHCSEVTCSGCFSDIPQCGNDLPFAANCTTNFDETVCKPKSAAIQLLRQRKSR